MKISMKEKVLIFVESKGLASYTEIIKFVVDTKFGDGTYDSGKDKDTTNYWDNNSNTLKSSKANIWRGYYSGAMSGWKPYFLQGEDRLVKADKKYIVVRSKK
jgi:hypothetical protein